MHAFLFSSFFSIHVSGKEEGKAMDETNISLYEKREFKVRKRRIPLYQPYFKGVQAKRNNGLINQQIFVYKHFETSFNVKAGEVFLARFPIEFGSEIHGDHFVVALLDSSPLNPLMTVIPLKSEKGKALNPASDIRIGVISGINNNKRSIAVINQIRSIDKRRLINESSINALHSQFRENSIGEYQEVCVQMTNVYRLTNEQLKLVRKTAIGFLISNYVSHDDELLVDF